MNAILTFILRLILIVLSYAFLGWVGYTIYRDLNQPSAASLENVFPPISLTAQTDTEILQKRFEIPEVTIGRDPASDFPLKHETISLRHCRLSYHHKQWWLEDLDSKNGTFLNENQIEDPVVITDHDQLRLGKITLTIQLNK